MSYKTILLQVDDSIHLNSRVEIAARIAVAEDAHLIGLAVTGISRYLYQMLTVTPDAMNLGAALDVLRERAEDALTRSENIARTLGVKSYEKRTLDGDEERGFSLQARCCDLTVLGQPDPADTNAATPSDLPEYLIMNSGGPCLVVPALNAAGSESMGKRVLVAWNGSIEAARAIRLSLPVLKKAKIVELVLFNPSAQPDLYAVPPGSDVQAYLARHEIKADVIIKENDEPVGTAMRKMADNVGADMVVMGCYGHSRFREILLGGATRSMLESATIPVLMAH